MKISEAIIGYRLYEDSVERLGTAEVTLPEISNLKTEIQGAGILGVMQSNILGHIEAMTMTMNFRTFEKSVTILHEPRWHKIEIYVAQQNRDTVSGKMGIDKVKYIIEIFPGKMSPGKAAPATTGDASGEYSVGYYACEIGGKMVFEIDQRNNVYKINGTDYMADVRAALGL